MIHTYEVQGDESEFVDLISQSPSAMAIVHGGKQFSSILGRVLFFESAGGVVVIANLQNLPYDLAKCSNNILAFHIHEGSSCRDEGPQPFDQTLGHFNPQNCMHPAHAGDLPPIFVGRDGNAFMAVWTDRFDVSQIVGKTVVVHSKRDDFTSQPAGDSGVKIACGEIKNMKL